MLPRLIRPGGAERFSQGDCEDDVEGSGGDCLVLVSLADGSALAALSQFEERESQSGAWISMWDEVIIAVLIFSLQGGVVF